MRKFLYKNQKYKKKNYIYPKFSIITVVKNNRKKIIRLIKSLKKLKYQNFEHIIINSCSTDGTTELVNKVVDYPLIHLVENDKGIYHAMNKGILLSRGDYLCIVNSDDQLTPYSLNIIRKYILKLNRPDFIFGSVIKGRLIHSGFHPKKIFYKFNIFPSHSGGMFLNRKVHKKLGLYNTRFKFSADCEFIYKMIKNNLRGYCTKHREITAIFDTSGISSKLSFSDKIKEEMIIRKSLSQNICFIFLLILFNYTNKFRNYLFNSKEKKSF